MHHFTPPEVCESFSCSTSCPVLDMANLFNLSHYGNCVVVFHLWFVLFWRPVMLSSFSYIYWLLYCPFAKCLLKSVTNFSIGLSVFFLLIWGVVKKCILDSNQHYKYFLPILTCLFTLLMVCFDDHEVFILILSYILTFIHLIFSCP